MGTIELRGLRTVMHIGVPALERAVAQPIEVDLDIELDLEAASLSDAVNDTADYGVISTAVVAALTAAPVSLLERAARIVADTTLAVAPQTTAVVVVIRKLRPPVPVDLDTAAVRLRVSR
jgi:dihydroneopterin aldolase